MASWRLQNYYREFSVPKMRKLVQELKGLLENDVVEDGDAGSAGGVGTGTAPSASGVTIGGAPAGGAPGSIYMGGSLPMPGTDQSGTACCSGCGHPLRTGGPCPNCGLRSLPLRAIGVPVRSFPKKKKHKKRQKKAKKS